MSTVRIPVVSFGEGVRADEALKILAIWAAALIDAHPSTRDYLHQCFNDMMSERLHKDG